MFKGIVKSPMKYFNQIVSTNPAELGAWMQERTLDSVSLYQKPGYMITYTLVGNIAKENRLIGK